MITLISPAKSLDFDTPATTSQFTQPIFLEDSQQLIDQLKKEDQPSIGQLMKLSEKLSQLNWERFQDWQQPFSPNNAKQAVLSFTGDVYMGLDAPSLSDQELQTAQGQLRILSGLYGLLKPLDLIQPYRLEMGTRLLNSRGKNLYEFWGSALTEALNLELSEQKNPVVINLASNEYFKAVQPKQLIAPVITPVFKDWKNGQYKMISFFAKRARGMMVRFILTNGIARAEDLSQFAVAGYRYDAELSTVEKPVFLRDEPNG